MSRVPAGIPVQYVLYHTVLASVLYSSFFALLVLATGTGLHGQRTQPVQGVSETLSPNTPE